MSLLTYYERTRLLYQTWLGVGIQILSPIRRSALMNLHLTS